VGLRDSVVPKVPRIREKHGAQCDATKVVIEYVDDRFEQGHDRYCKTDFLRIDHFPYHHQGPRILKWVY
jgi:hypothetical protein